MSEAAPVVSIIMGSDSDLPIMEPAATVLESLDVLRVGENVFGVLLEIV